ncbi:MAG TPA: DUF2993 domain-containing protein [Fimbriimonas sp.]|nr:DUF2993 domain-containing protein [Fimbriimonas sp.]
MKSNPWLLGGIAALFGIGSALVKDFERAAARDILSKVSGPEAFVKLQISYPGLLSPAIGEIGTAKIIAGNFHCDGLPLYTEPKRSQRGTIRSLQLELTNFKLRDLQCRSFTATIPDCRFDFALARSKRQVRLSKSGTGTGAVEIMASDLPAFILKKYREIKSVKVTIDEGRVKVAGRGEFLVLTADFEISARLAANGTQILLKDAVVRLDGKPADPESEQALLNAMNPILDFDRDLDLYDSVQATSVEVLSDRMRVEGKVKVATKPD